MKEPLLLRTLHGKPTERPPIWIMRQAGRILPQYRALRSSLSGFKELVETPDLAAEVSLQPVDELNVDAAIIFSDILVIPEAMGLSYEMIKGKGPHFPTVIERKSQIDHLIDSEDHIRVQLSYVYDALKRTREGLSDEKTLIGFSGAPWTLLAYMIEGGGSKTFSKARKFLYSESQLAHRLLDKLTKAIIYYLEGQVEAGAQVIQLFDSWAGLLSPVLYEEFCMPYINRILSSISVPSIFFAKGAYFMMDRFNDLACEAIGLDWTIRPRQAALWIKQPKILQGNLDPAVLYANPKKIEKDTLAMLHSFPTRHIVNLGHGVYPDTPLEHVRTFVNSVRSFRYEKS